MSWHPTPKTWRCALLPILLLLTGCGDSADAPPEENTAPVSKSELMAPSQVASQLGVALNGRLDEAFTTQNEHSVGEPPFAKDNRFEGTPALPSGVTDQIKIDRAEKKSLPASPPASYAPPAPAPAVAVGGGEMAEEKPDNPPAKGVQWSQNGVIRTQREDSLYGGRGGVGKEGAKSPLADFGGHPAPQPTLAKALSTTRKRKKDQGVAAEQDAFLRSDSPTPHLPAREILDPTQAGKNFLDTRETLQGLTFQETEGHWANTHVPGDPAMRLLDAQLRQNFQSLLGWGYPNPTKAESMPLPVTQPSDLPWNTALAFTLHADRRGIEGPSRVRAQLGIRGSQRQGGHRPTMKLALILDLRQTHTIQAATLPRALVAALSKTRQPGDRFLLLALGEHGSLRLEPEDFRHGPLQELLARCLGGTPPPDGPKLDIAAALAIAREYTRLSDEPTATLGSNLILLATPAIAPEEVNAVELATHESAIQTSPVSVISLGPPADGAAIDRIVAAGLGNRRLLTAADQADALIDRELLAASQMVARAIRVVFRLAPGVKLVDIPGSYPLDAPQAAMVRQTEQALDQQLAKRLGLAADRTDDEDGLRIVIPSFHAGTEHTILLDLATQGAGPVVEVTVRYKDLVYMKNGVFRQTLHLAAHNETAGPLEQNVIKNELAVKFALTLQQAGQEIAANRLAQAQSLLAGFKNLLASLSLHFPGWDRDPDIQGDLAFLTLYLSSLQNMPPQQPPMRDLTAAALRVAGFRKLIPGVSP